MTFTLCIFECVQKNILKHIGDEDEGGTPVPMPNTAVKPLDAENTWAKALGRYGVANFYIFLVSSVGRAHGC